MPLCPYTLTGFQLLCEAQCCPRLGRIHLGGYVAASPALFPCLASPTALNLRFSNIVKPAIPSPAYVCTAQRALVGRQVLPQGQLA